MSTLPDKNEGEFTIIQEIAKSKSDRPVLMLNLNTYFDGRRTMSSAAYSNC